MKHSAAEIINEYGPFPGVGHQSLSACRAVA